MSLKYYNSIIRFSYFSALLFSFFIPFGFIINRYILALFIISGFLAGFPNFKFIWHKKNLFLIFTSLLFLLYLLSVLWSQNKFLAYVHIQKMLPIFFLPIVFALIPLHKRHKKNILLAFISGLFVASVYCFGNFVYQILSDSQFAQNFYSQPLGQLYSTFYIFDHTSYYSAYLVFSIIVIFKFFCDNTFPKFKKQIRFAGIFLVIVFALLTFLISSRAGLIGLVVLSFVLAYQNFKNIYIRVVLFSLLIFVSVMVFTNTRFIKTLGVFESVLEQEEFDKKTISKHSALRLVLWEASFDVIEENLFTGVGTGDVRDELWHKVVDDYGFELDKEFNPHNQFLSTFMATGIVGFLALLGIFVFGFMESFRKQNLFLLNLLILLFIHFQFETMMGRLNGILFFSFFLSILFYYNRKYADDSLIYF